VTLRSPRSVSISFVSPATSARRRAPWRAALGATLSLLVAGAAHAQPANEVALPDTAYLAGEVEPQKIGLSLEQAEKLADANSPTSRAALAALQSAGGSRMKQAGAFDPVLLAADQRISTDSPVTSPFAASKVRIRSLTGGATWLSPIGTQLNVSLSQIRTESNAPFNTLPRERRAVGRVDFVQPLLAGFGLAATRGDLRAADRELDAARMSYAAATLDLNADVENAYWDLFAAERNLEVQRAERQRAAVFLRQQILRSQAGAVGPSAVATARAFLAAQDALLLNTRIQLGATADRLAELIGAAAGDTARYHATDEPPPPGDVEPLESALARALAANPSLRAQEEAAAAAEARARKARRNAWPAIDAFGGYGGSGLAGTGQQVVFGSDTLGTNFDTKFGDAWDQVFGDDNPDWNFGIRVNVPLGWRAARGEREVQAGNAKRAHEQARAARLALESAVRRAHREATLSRQGLVAVREAQSATREQARIARLEYQAGRTTAYDLVNIEADVSRAEFGVSEVLVRVARATTELRRLTTPAPGRTR